MPAIKVHDEVPRLAEARHQLFEQEVRLLLRTELSRRFFSASARRGYLDSLATFGTGMLLISFVGLRETELTNPKCLYLTKFSFLANILQSFSWRRAIFTDLKRKEHFLKIAVATLGGMVH